MEIVKREKDLPDLPEVEPTEDQIREYCRRSGAPFGAVSRLVRRHYRPGKDAEVVARANEKRARKEEARKLNQTKSTTNNYETHPTKK